MSQHLIKEVQQLKHEVAQLKEGDYGYGNLGRAYEGPTAAAELHKRSSDPADMWTAIDTLTKKVEDLERKLTS